MKLISIFDTFFELPDEFNGSYGDALRLLANYIDSPHATILNDKCKIVIKEDPWGSFMEVVEMGGKMSGTFGLKHWDGVEWKDIKNE